MTLTGAVLKNEDSFFFSGKPRDKLWIHGWFRMRRRRRRASNWHLQLIINPERDLGRQHRYGRSQLMNLKEADCSNR